MLLDLRSAAIARCAACTRGNTHCSTAVLLLAHASVVPVSHMLCGTSLRLAGGPGSDRLPMLVAGLAGSSWRVE
jgi:hypothetical protein